MYEKYITKHIEHDLNKGVDCFFRGCSLLNMFSETSTPVRIAGLKPSAGWLAGNWGPDKWDRELARQTDRAASSRGFPVERVRER